jgi:hypothetical protein
MKTVNFSAVKVNQTFSYNGKEYVKLETKKVSCCKFTNAHLVGDPNQKIGIKPTVIVEVSE